VARTLGTLEEGLGCGRNGQKYVTLCAGVMRVEGGVK